MAESFEWTDMPEDRRFRIVCIAYDIFLTGIIAYDMIQTRRSWIVVGIISYIIIVLCN